MIKINPKVGYFGECPICHKDKRLIATQDDDFTAESYDQRLFVCLECAVKIRNLTIERKKEKGKEFKAIFL